MQIKINRFNDESVTIDFKPAVGEEYPTFEETLHMMFSALDGILHRFLDDKKIRKNWEFREHIYDQLDYLFDALLTNVFPEIKPNEFDMTPAAIVYAQDMMIKEAAEEGISYQEALERYEQKAKDYIIHREKLN